MVTFRETRVLSVDPHRPSPTTAAHVLRDLNRRIPLILDGGPTAIGLESTVLDLTGPFSVLLRPGGVTLEQLRASVCSIQLHPDAELLRRSPGTRYRHYQPRTPMVLVLPHGPTAALVEEYRARRLITGLVCRGSGRVSSWPDVRVQSLSESLSGYARGLFAAIRALDDSGVGVIVVEGVEEHGLGLAVMDRLRRAASRVVDRAGRSTGKTR